MCRPRRSPVLPVHMGRRAVLTRVLRAVVQRLDPVKNPMHAKVERLVQAPVARH
jgi:hypothetical protein